MDRRLFICFALFAVSCAMVPMERHALNSDEEEVRLDVTTVSTTSAGPVQICAAQTPCGWVVYRPNTKIPDFNMTNTYCQCAEDLKCQVSEDDSSGTASILRCRRPEHAQS